MDKMKWTYTEFPDEGKHTKHEPGLYAMNGQVIDLISTPQAPQCKLYVLIRK